MKMRAEIYLCFIGVVVPFLSGGLGIDVAVRTIEEGQIIDDGQVSKSKGKHIIPSHCASLTCPDECELTYHDGCPHNCNCGPPKKCPRVNCPFPFPRCIILTQLNGCQTCGCKDPYVILADKLGNREVLFVRLIPFEQSEFFNQTESDNDTDTIRITQKELQSIPRINPEDVSKDTTHILFEKALADGGDAQFIRIGEKVYVIDTYPVFNRTESDINQKCTEEHQDLIDSAMKKVYSFLGQRKNPAVDSAGLAFPMAFRYSKRQLESNCKDYRDAIKKIPGSLLRPCYLQHRIFSEAFATFDYPCGYSSSWGFFRHYECLRGTSKNGTMLACQSEARSRFLDPFVSLCDTYNILLDCIYDPVVYLCGYDAWEIEYQYLRQNIRVMGDQTCELQRIYRELKYLTF